jgi:hypothetical protein
METNEARHAAEVAKALSEAMNLLFLFAAPRVLESVRSTGSAGLDGATVREALRRFLRQASDIRARNDSRSTADPDVARLVSAAMIVEEIAGALGPSPFESSLAPPVVERARRALLILGFPDPPGGWDAFDGFSLPNPPPSPRTG